jgi:hypothetical protein
MSGRNAHTSKHVAHTSPVAVTDSRIDTAQPGWGQSQWRVVVVVLLLLSLLPALGVSALCTWTHRWFQTKAGHGPLQAYARILTCSSNCQCVPPARHPSQQCVWVGKRLCQIIGN